MRKQIESACERFIDINRLSDTEAADKIRLDKVDILVNLGGYTQYMRNGIFALMPASIQVQPLYEICFHGSRPFNLLGLGFQGSG